jgi:hypothetical protein
MDLMGFSLPIIVPPKEPRSPEWPPRLRGFFFSPDDEFFSPDDETALTLRRYGQKTGAYEMSPTFK